MVNASVSSSLVVAAVQGALGGVTFWLLGVGAPLFWGVLMGVCCLLPFGAWVVWAPAAIWLVVSGHLVRGIVLAGLGAGVVSSVDNVLRPVLLSSRSEMNGLLMFVSLLGGVVAFGTLGLVAGPVLMAAAIALLDAFTSQQIMRMPAPQAETRGWNSGRER
jgi:predicted PurR-regulated permease PerM